jgi:hypothetical protein
MSHVQRGNALMVGADDLTHCSKSGRCRQLNCSFNLAFDFEVPIFDDLD